MTIEFDSITHQSVGMEFRVYLDADCAPAQIIPVPNIIPYYTNDAKEWLYAKLAAGTLTLPKVGVLKLVRFFAPAYLPCSPDPATDIAGFVVGERISFADTYSTITVSYFPPNSKAKGFKGNVNKVQALSDAHEETGMCIVPIYAQVLYTESLHKRSSLNY